MKYLLKEELDNLRKKSKDNNKKNKVSLTEKVNEF